MQKLMAAIGAALLAASVTGSSGAVAEPTATGGFVRIAPEALHWVTVPGTPGFQQAVLLGDPSKPGLYVIRGRFPPHVMDTPHTHSMDRYVTVIQGTWYTGTGPVFDPAAAVPMKAGSVMFHPANGVHWDGSAGDEPVIVQIMGMGPVSTTPVDPKGPAWATVKTPAAAR